MSEKNLHPTIEEFKQFINKYPKLRVEIRKSGSSWQEYYEKWILLGEDDSFWESYSEAKEGATDNEFMSQLIKMTENIDLNKVQKQVGQLNNTINIVNELLNDFVKTDNQGRKKRPHLFDMFKD